MTEPHPPTRRVARLAWITLGVNLLVILWGAWVRASGSGAGCGNHWPLCNGEVLPRSPTIETVTELTHRVSSGLALLLVLGMTALAWRDFPRRHRVRRAAVASLLLIVVEALIGAGLVKFALVADNASIQRALTLGAHLVNTQFLIAAIVLTGWWASGRPPIDLRRLGSRGWWLAAATLALLAVGLTGAVASLGDTLFPARSLGEGLAQDFDPTSHLLLRLRILHPAGALLTGLALIGLVRWVAGWPETADDTRQGATQVTVMVGVQWAIGFTALLLLVPVPLQLLHLLGADLLWLSWVLFVARGLAATPPD